MLFGEHLVVVRGGGDLATGSVFRLHKAGFPVLVLELEQPLAIRRTVALASAVLEDRALIEDLDAMRIDDIEEAVLLGDRIVLMREGKIVQVGPPEELWRNPGHQFVRDFFGDEFGLRILSRHRVADLTLGPPPARDVPTVSQETNLRDVLAVMVTHTTDSVAVVDRRREKEGVVGSLTFREVISQIRKTT